MNTATFLANSHKLLNGLYQFLEENEKDFGTIYKYKGLFNFYFVCHPDELKKIYVGTNRDYTRTTKYNKIVQSVFSDNSLFFADHEEWMTKRKKLNPFFTKQNVKQYHGMMHSVISEIIGKMVIQLSGDKAKSMDIYDISNQMIIKIVMGAFFNKKLKEEEFSEIMEWINVMRDYLGRIPYPIVSDPQMPTYLNLKIKKYEQKFRNFIKEILDERIKGSNDPEDLLSLIIKLYGKENEKGEIEIDEEAVVREIYLAIFAGYETSSATITWVFHLLAENKDKYEKLQREIDSSMKMDSISTEKIMELKYVDHVLSEVLRIKTAPWITGRTAKKDVEISGQHVKKDSMVVLCPHFAHHDSNYWDDPKKFVPERWEDTNQNNINKNSYMPFGAGPRKCIGMDFSKAEMKVIMVLMLMNFEFDIDPDFTVKTAYGMTAYPENGLKMLVKRRNQD